ncbi:MAG: hypothetical protein H7Y88_08835 [Phycisphaerales bacterium]|nr:hypothetical protein [Phycisphaerales bacterium]
MWRNGGWASVETPSLRPQTEYPYSPRSGFAYAAEVISHDDVWVVGQADGFGDAVTSSVALALHWDGSGWEDVPTPIAANRTHRFDAVSASASNDVWVVGTSRAIAGPFLGFIQRWDGNSWSVVSHPALTIPQSQFHEVLAIDSDEVWVAGAINYTDPLLYRWNGSSWETPPIPGGSGNAVIALVGTSRNSIYAATSGPVTSIFPLDGTSWTEVPNPPPPQGQVDSVRSLAAAGPCDVWAVGSQMDSTGFYGALIEHLTPDAAPCPADFNGDGGATSRRS